jgi:hypothetical protein
MNVPRMAAEEEAKLEIAFSKKVCEALILWPQ